MIFLIKLLYRKTGFFDMGIVLINISEILLQLTWKRSYIKKQVTTGFTTIQYYYMILENVTNVCDYISISRISLKSTGIHGLSIGLLHGT